MNSSFKIQLQERLSYSKEWAFYFSSKIKHFELSNKIEIEIYKKKPISYFLQSPALHWLHHSNNPKHFNCNIGNTYTIWDKLFGTYIDE